MGTFLLILKSRIKFQNIEMYFSIPKNEMFLYRDVHIGVYGVNDDSLVNTKDKKLKQRDSEGGNDKRNHPWRPELWSGKNNKSQIVGPYGEDTRNDNGNRLITTCEQNNLKIMNGYYQHRDCKNTHKYNLQEF